MLTECRVSAPRQVEPDLQVEKVLTGEGACHGVERRVPEVVAATGEEFVIPRVGAHEVVPVGLEEMLQQQTLVWRGEIGGGEQRPLAPEVTHLPSCEFPDLFEQDRGEVEDQANLRVPFGHRGHVEVALYRVETHPGHQRGPRERVHVIRLVHVPEQGDVKHERSVSSER